MKTIRWLKVSIVLQAIYAFFCISASICFALCYYLDNYSFFKIANILTFGWIVNPIGLLSVIIGLICYFSEKGSEENRAVIGEKWLWFVRFFVIDFFLYFGAVYALVRFTGGV